jgi:hypothetical protein
MERVKRAAKQTDAHGSVAVPFYSGEFASILTKPRGCCSVGIVEVKFREVSQAPKINVELR